MDEIDEVPVAGDGIKLGQFLKLVNLIESGGEAKELLAEGLVQVNGEPESRRGRQLVDGDLVRVGPVTARVRTGS